jgi:RimJ/RimL family protein N-acetyltransferase
MSVSLQPLTNYKPSLATIYLKWFNDPEIADKIAPFGGLPDTAESCEEWMRGLSTNKEEKRFTILLNVENYRPIGDCGLTYIDYHHKEAGVSIFIAEKQLRGQRLGQLTLKKLIKYAFDNLHLKMLYLTTDADYPLAVKAYEAVGFNSHSIIELCRGDGTPYNQLLMELRKQRS